MGTQAPDPDTFLVLENGPEVEIKVRGSRFIGQGFHAPCPEAALASLDAVRRNHHAATHHCWAARMGGPEDLQERCDDDGEPSGTAGPPILKPLTGRRLHQGLVVVTRYYGGVKLGTGGLARAYSEAASAALDRAPVRTVIRQEALTLTIHWEDVGAVEAVLARAGGQVLAVSREFQARPHLKVTVRRSAAEGLRRDLVDATGGRSIFNG